MVDREQIDMYQVFYFSYISLVCDKSYLLFMQM